MEQVDSDQARIYFKNHPILVSNAIEKQTMLSIDVEETVTEVNSRILRVTG